MFSVIVPVKNGLDYTRPFIESVLTTNPGVALEWVVVDSGSTDGTLEYCESIGARVVPFRSQPFNYCAAVNAGAAVARGDLWMVANNDLEFRSHGDLARVEQIFREWPLLAVLSPGRAAGEAELEFAYDRVNGATWVVRPEAFLSWGRMPEALSGYGYDEVYTVFQCWKHGYALASLTGWDVHHYGSVTFGPEAGNVSPALRRNLSRLLRVMEAVDLDGSQSPDQIIGRLKERELARAATRVGVPATFADQRWLVRQGYAGAQAVKGEGEALIVPGSSASGKERQWLPWLANELLLQPDAPVVGGDGWWAVRPEVRFGELAEPERRALLAGAQSLGPAAPRLMPAIAPKRPTWRQRISAVVHSWRQRKRELLEGW